MTRSEGIRIVDEWVAEKILLDRGYTKLTCTACEGNGRVPQKPAVDTGEFPGMAARVWERRCDHCEGAGWRWKAPDVAPVTQLSAP